MAKKKATGVPTNENELQYSLEVLLCKLDDHGDRTIGSHVKTVMSMGFDPEYFRVGIKFSPFLKWCRDDDILRVRAFLPHIKNINFVPPTEDYTQDLPEAQYPMSALMLAAYNGNIEIVSMLLAAGADPSVKNAKGHCALELLNMALKEKLFDGYGRRIQACRRLLAGAAAVKALEAELGAEMVQTGREWGKNG
jgi:hypothetical protein